MPDHDPLILTLHLAEADAAAFERLRRRHFPPGLNRVPAHVTLFHRLPGAEIGPVRDRLAASARAAAPFALRVETPVFLGRGVALRLDAARLGPLRALLAAAWRDWLSPQDRQPYRPHVTIQNKVAPEAARALHATLARDFRPWEAQAAGLALWHYRGGPWEADSLYPFAAPGPE